MAPRLRRRMEDSVGMIPQTLVASIETDEPVDVVVVWFHIVVADRPVVAESVDALPSEVIRSKAQGNPTPMIRASAEHAGAPPAELCARRPRVRLAVDLPAAIASVELAE